MQDTSRYQSPLGEILLTSDDGGLTGLWFTERRRFFAQAPETVRKDANLPVLEAAGKWLDCYFSGREPDFMPPLHPAGTDFQKEVLQILRAIPYGQTVTYGEIAAQIAKAHGIKRMSARAVGGAVGRNPISIMIPCHRVVGANGNLTGYGGGIDRKIKLLALEHIDVGKFYYKARGK